MDLRVREARTGGGGLGWRLSGIGLRRAEGGMLASGQARSVRGSVVGAGGSSRRVGGGLPSAAGTGYDKDQASASFAQ